MASNLDYLAPGLVPLEEQVQAYLAAEKALRAATAAQRNAPVPRQEETRGAASSGQHPLTFSHPSADDKTAQTVAGLRAELTRLEGEILTLLPTRDEWVKVNLGYGPSRVGAWKVPATGGSPERYELRVVH